MAIYMDFERYQPATISRRFLSCFTDPRATEAESAMELLESTEGAPEIESTCERIVRDISSLRDRLLLSNKASHVESSRKLSQRMVALQYRSHRLQECHPEQTLQEQLQHMVLEWQRSHPLQCQQELSAADLEKICEASRYRDFVALLADDPKLRDSFFTWAFRNGLDVKTFVEFPSFSERLTTANLAQRIGLFAPQKLKLDLPKEHAPQPLLNRISLPMNTYSGITPVDILDPTGTVDLNGDWRLQIAEIFQIFQDKADKVGKLEYFPHSGIYNWNSHEMGAWDESNENYIRPSLEGDNWWENLPTFMELDKGQVEERYDVSLEPGQWVVCPKATRESPDLFVLGTHGYLEIAIPLSDGRYRIYPFGKYAAYYPVSAKEKLSFAGNTVEGRIVYPDESVYSSDRQQGGHPLKVNQVVGLKVMESIRKDVISGLDGNIVFQMGSENCAHWIEETIQKTVPNPPRNIYRMDMLDSDWRYSVLIALFAFFRAMPRFIKNCFLRLLGLVFGSWRIRRVVEEGAVVHRSLYSSPVHQEGILYHSGKLIERVQTGELQGRVTFGHQN